MTRRPLRIATLLLLGSLQVGILTASAVAADSGFTRYTDPERRFSFDYPSTMKVRAAGNDEVKVTHPGATLRITVLVEKRRRTASASAELLLDAFRKTLKAEMKDAAVLEEGKLPGLAGSQGYIVCSLQGPTRNSTCPIDTVLRNRRPCVANDHLGPTGRVQEP